MSPHPLPYRSDGADDDLLRRRGGDDGAVHAERATWTDDADHPPLPCEGAEAGSGRGDPAIQTGPGGEVLLALHYGDSAYPAGGYAHSFGLETAVAEEDVQDARTLAEAARALLTHTVARTDAVAAAGCARAMVMHDLALLKAVDHRLSATRAAREPREASLRMGRRLIDTAATVEGDGRLAELRERVRAGQTPGNHACMLGAVAGVGGLAPATAAALCLWTAATGIVSAAVRLLRLRPEEGQGVLRDLRLLAAELAAPAAAADPMRMAGGAPAFDIWCMHHETAEVRLFAS